MGQKAWCITAIIIICSIIGFLWWINYSSDKSITINEQYIQYLEGQLDSLKTLEKEVELKIDTVTIEIEKVKIEYEERHNTILNNTPSEDYKFFTDYINSNRERLYTNFSRGTEDN